MCLYSSDPVFSHRLFNVPAKCPEADVLSEQENDKDGKYRPVAGIKDAFRVSAGKDIGFHVTVQAVRDLPWPPHKTARADNKSDRCENTLTN